MGTVIEFVSRDRRDQRARMLAAAGHPALRWTAGTAAGVAHRRNSAGSAVCGAVGRLELAGAAVPRCGDCYPADGRRGAASG